MTCIQWSCSLSATRTVSRHKWKICKSSFYSEYNRTWPGLVQSLLSWAEPGRLWNVSQCVGQMTLRKNCLFSRFKGSSIYYCQESPDLLLGLLASPGTLTQQSISSLVPNSQKDWDLGLINNVVLAHCLAVKNSFCPSSPTFCIINLLSCLMRHPAEMHRAFPNPTFQFQVFSYKNC